MADAQDDVMLGDEAALHIMVLYDELDAGILAKKIYDSVFARLPKGAAAKLSLWRFDAIAEAKTARLAHRDLGEADVLMVAADGTRALPRGLQDALEKRLLAKGATRLGLMEILHGVEEQEKEFSPVHAYLDELARKAKTDFFSQAIAPPSQDESALMRSRRPLTVDFVWDEEGFAGAIPIARWGINE